MIRTEFKGQDRGEVKETILDAETCRRAFEGQLSIP